MTELFLSEGYVNGTAEGQGRLANLSIGMLKCNMGPSLLDALLRGVKNMGDEEFWEAHLDNLCDLHLNVFNLSRKV